MDVLFDRVAGLDVGKAWVTVCVRTPGPDGRRLAETRTFSTMTRSLEFMADWLVECGVTLAAMESTATHRLEHVQAALVELGARIVAATAPWTHELEFSNQVSNRSSRQ